jgi:tRNA A37 threonylcarbamoyladenosine biosynthesis protein TsaE
VTAVEWAERLPEDLREGGTRLHFAVDEQADARTIELSSLDERLLSAAASALSGGAA